MFWSTNILNYTRQNIVIRYTYLPVYIFYFWSEKYQSGIGYLYQACKQWKRMAFINPIPTGLGHVTLIYGLIPPMAGRNRVKHQFTEFLHKICHLLTFLAMEIKVS